jgi:hypothetical protein
MKAEVEVRSSLGVELLVKILDDKHVLRRHTWVAERDKQDKQDTPCTRAGLAYPSLHLVHYFVCNLANYEDRTIHCLHMKVVGRL